MNYDAVAVAQEPMPLGGSALSARRDKCSVWATNGEYYLGEPQVAERLPAGFYHCLEVPMKGPALQAVTVSTDDLYQLKDETSEMLLKEFVTFWKAGETFKQLGLSQKRGVMLWGPPGAGKTSAIQLMAKHMIDEMDGVVVFASNPHLTAVCLQSFRQIEPDRPLVVLYEDIDGMVERYGPHDLLALLDGELQVDRVVSVATTNFPERLGPRFADRPGRFDRVAEVPMPSDEVRERYIRKRVPNVSDDTVDLWVSASKGWGIAHLRELIVATQALGESSEAVILRLEEMSEIPVCDESFRGRSGGKEIGFTNGRY
ncbi:MAG: ATP-binding protein [Pseudomonadota bacterium]